MIGNVFGDGLLVIGTEFDEEDHLRSDWLVMGVLV